jgi:flagellar biosynthesis protein FlhB
VSEKTEQPTQQRLNKAREEGDSGVSGFASQALGFLVAVTLLPAAIAALAQRAGVLVRSAITASSTTPVSARLDVPGLATDLLSLTLPLLGAVALTSAVASMVQSGGGFSTKKLAVDFSRLDPFAGVARLFKMDRVFAVARSLVAATFVAWRAWKTLFAAARDLAQTSGRLEAAVALAGSVAVHLARDAALLGVGLAVIDLVVTRRSWLSRLKMGKDEVKRERRENDGDPQLKSARERAHQEVMTSVVLAKVREATVVVVNPTHLACALRYDEKEGDAAPVVVASGRGDLAARIVQAAEAYGVPVLRDVPLARALIELEVGDVIPEALYEAVAEILKAAWEET